MHQNNTATINTARLRAAGLRALGDKLHLVSRWVAQNADALDEDPSLLHFIKGMEDDIDNLIYGIKSELA